MMVMAGDDPTARPASLHHTTRHTTRHNTERASGRTHLLRGRLVLGAMGGRGVGRHGDGVAQPGGVAGAGLDALVRNHAAEDEGGDAEVLQQVVDGRGGEDAVWIGGGGG